MKTKKDSPGVYPPPPLFYVAIFFISILLQHYISLSNNFFEGEKSHYLAALFLSLGVISVLPALITFYKSKNTLVTILPAKSLQTKNIYSITRNPMYLGLLFIYTGVALIKGNWWTIILIPLVIFLINQLVIIREEKYLERAFGQEFLDYKNKVRRWI
jgi:protein-S-isoprenylcysteine O-methyltransferase Ste14